MAGNYNGYDPDVYEDYTRDSENNKKITYYMFDTSSESFTSVTTHFDEVHISEPDKEKNVTIADDVSSFFDTKNKDDVIHGPKNLSSDVDVVVFAGSGDDDAKDLAGDHDGSMPVVFYLQDGNDKFIAHDGDSGARAVQVFGGDGRDNITGRHAPDVIIGGGGSDVIDGKEGSDYLTGDDSEDTISGGKGDDIIYGGNGADQIKGQDGDDLIYGNDHDDVILGGQGSDTIDGGGGNDIIDPGPRNTESVDTVWLGAGNDQVYTGNLEGTAPADSSAGNLTETVVDTSVTMAFSIAAATPALGPVAPGLEFIAVASDPLIKNFLFGASSTDQALEFPKDDFLNVMDFNVGEDIVIANTTYSASNTMITEPVNSDTALEISSDSQGVVALLNMDDELATDVASITGLSSLTVKEQMLERAAAYGIRVTYDQATDTKTVTLIDINSTFEGDPTYIAQLLDGIPMTDGQSILLLGAIGPQLVSGDQWSATDNGEKLYTGGFNADILMHRPTDGLSYGQLFSVDGYFIGYGGDDFYDSTGSIGYNAFYGGDGSDTVSYVGALWDDAIANGLPIDSIAVRGLQADLSLGVEQAIRKSGSVADLSDIALFDSVENLFGSVYDDALKGDAADNEINGVHGNDVIHGGDGNDELTGGDDDTSNVDMDDPYASYMIEDADTLYGEAGDDTLIGGRDDDLLYGGDDNDEIDGESGNDSLFGDGGADILRGGGGNDTADGGEGSDTVHQFASWGNLTVDDTGSSGTDVLRLHDSWKNLSFGLSDGNVVVTGDGWNGSTTVEGGIETYTTDDQSLSASAVKALAATPPDDLSAFDTIQEGTSGNDTLNDDLGNDLVFGGDGDDGICSGDGDDWLIGGIGADTIVGGAGEDTISWLYGDGDDAIDGGSETDQLMVNLDDGIAGSQTSAAFSVNAMNELEMLVGSDTITVINVEYLHIIADPDGSTVSGEGALTAAGISENTIRFEGGAGNDHFDGTGILDVRLILDGGGGDDVLYGGHLDDILSGGPGNNVMRGGQGSDTFQELSSELMIGSIHDFGSDDQIVLREHQYELPIVAGTSSNGTTILVDQDGMGAHDGFLSIEGSLANGRQIPDFSVRRFGNDIHIQLTEAGSSPLGGSGATILRTGEFLGPNFVRGLALQEQDFVVLSSTEAKLPMPFPGGILGNEDVEYTMTVYGTGFGVTENGRYTGVVERFVAEGTDGTAWHVSGYNASLNQVNTAATEQDFVQNLLVPIQWNYIGNNTPDYFICASFTDTFLGFGGDDTFQGLDGDDVRRGGAGRDKLHDQAGVDKIFAGKDDDIVRGGSGADVLSGQRGDDNFHGGADTDQIYGGPGDDFVKGGSGGDSIRGGGGNDQIYGGRGADDISGGAGRDYILGGDQGDTLNGGGGADILFGQDSADRILGGNGDDVIDGGTSSDLVFGNRGNDNVQGGEASDFIDGGRGNDFLAGNALSAITPDNAPDTFIFEGRFGHDVITDFEENWDGIRLTGVTSNAVTIDYGGEDVQISVHNPDFPGAQSILVEGAASFFDPQVDIVYMDNSALI